MKNELQQHKKSDKVKWIFTGIAFIFVFIILAGLILQAFGTDKTKPSEWFKQEQEENENVILTDVHNDMGAMYVDKNDSFVSAYALSDNCSHIGVDSSYYVPYTITNAVSALLNQQGDANFSRESTSDALVVKFVNAETEESVITMNGVNWARYKATCKKYVRDVSSLQPNATKAENYTVYCVDICIHDFRVQIEETGIVFQNFDLTSLKFESSYWQKKPTCTYYSDGDYLRYRIYTTSSTNPLTKGGYTFKVSVGNIPPDPVKEGYTFAGWYLDEACTIPFTGTTVTEDITLYAGWQINTYTLTLNGNGGEVNPATVTGEYNTVPTIPKPVRTGYIFMGWKTESGKTYNVSSALTQDLTLVAQWQASICTLTLNANGGEIAETSVSGEYNTVPEIPVPVRFEHTFLGWKTESGQDYDISSPLTGDLTLTAQWKLNTYTLTLNGNGGELTQNSVSGDYNTTPTIPTPTRTGYTFTGWQTESGEEYDVSLPFTQDLTLTAQWRINTYTLTLNGNGGELTQNIISGDYNTIPEIPEPIRTGYHFMGWKTESGQDYDISSPLTDNLTLAAQWEINLYKVTFMVDGVVYKEKYFEHGTKLSYVTESTVPELFALYTLNTGGESLASDYAIDGDLTVHAEKGTTAQKVKGNWKKIVIGGVCGAVMIAFLCCIPSIVKNRKRRG